MAAPRKTVADLLLAVRTNLDENVASFWSDAQLVAYLDQEGPGHGSGLRLKSLKADYGTIQRRDFRRHL